MPLPHFIGRRFNALLHPQWRTCPVETGHPLNYRRDRTIWAILHTSPASNANPRINLVDFKFLNGANWTVRRTKSASQTITGPDLQIRKLHLDSFRNRPGVGKSYLANPPDEGIITATLPRRHRGYSHLSSRLFLRAALPLYHEIGTNIQVSKVNSI